MANRDSSRTSNLRSRAAWSALLAIGGALMISSCHGPAHAAQQDAKATVAYTIDTPIRTLVTNARAKAIVDKYAPGLSEGPHYFMTAAFSLRQLQPMLHGMITDAELAQMARELAAIP
jgi:hypothetical protein